MSRFACCCALLLAHGCVESTGGALVTFNAAAAGPEEANGAPLVRDGDNGFGYRVTITSATFHIGAVYLNRSEPAPGAQETACVLQGIYNGQVRHGIDINLLAAELQPFPVRGEGTADPSTVAELWLVGGPVDANFDRTIILRFAGRAEKDGAGKDFSGQITINSNRAQPSGDVAQPGAHPICKQRIVSKLRVDFTPSQDGLLVVRIDPRPWFDNIDFADVPADPANAGALLFPDSNVSQQSKNLFAALRTAGSAYSITWKFQGE